jgi:outer membrane receptor protein involved in Fe transport
MSTRTILRTAILALLAASSTTHAADATTLAPKSIEVPAGSLASALESVAKQYGVNVIYTSSELRNVATEGVKGKLTAHQAVEKLLEGTLLTIKVDSSGAMMISAPAPLSSLDRTSWAGNDKSLRLAESGGGSTNEPSRNEQTFQLEEIVVTAQKREERLLDVPMAVTAVTGVEIARRGVSSLSDLQYSVPGLSLVAYGPGQERIQIRGVTTANGLPTVGRYLDEIPLSIDENASGLDLRLIDMKQIEVLRGPQGTLYGEGSMGGTIRYLTADADLTSFGGSVETQAGSVADGSTAWRVNGVVNLPVVQDRVGLRLVAGYENSGGWIDSLATGKKDINENEFLTLRGKLLAEITDNLQASILVLHQENEGVQNFGIDRTSNALVSELNSPKYDVVNAVLRLDLGWGTLVNSFGYLNARNDTTTDLSSVYVPVLPLLGVPAGFITSVGLESTSDIDVYTDELRLASVPGGVVDWTVGLYGRQLDRNGVSRTATVPGSLPFDLVAASATSKSEAWAAFGELAWHASDRLTLIGGLRYYDEKRTLTATSASFGLPATNANEGTFSSVNPRVNVSYKLSPDAMVYVSAAKGFRSGGFNSAAAGGPIAYDPEKLWTYELGTKQQWLERRVTLEGAVYYNDWKGVQSSFVPVGAAIGYITNGGKVNGWGVDATLTARPTSALTLSATYAWNDLEYKTASSEHAIGDAVDYAVRETWSGSIDYRRPLFGDVQGFARLDYQHAGPSSIINRGSVVNIAIDSRDTLNARLGLDFGRFDVAVFADNLTDVDTPVIPGPFGLIQQDVELMPRIVGVNFKARY